MNVQEALGLPSFDGASVIAGGAGLDGELTGAMVLEATDIENWGKKGQLIISSFFAFEHLSGPEVDLFFRSCASIGIAAIAFKPDRLMASAPEHVVALCDDFDLPLIRLAPAVKYDAIMLDVMGHILDSNLTLLNRFFEVHRHLMTLALKQPSIPYILGTLKNTLHADISYLDTTRDRRLSTDSTRTGFTGYALARRDPSPYQTHAYFDARLLWGDDPEPFGAGGGAGEGYADGEAAREERALAVRIPSSDGVDYYLIVHNDGRDLTPLDTMTVENIVSLLQMEILKQNAIKQRVFFQNNNTVHDLLLDRYGTRERIDSALAMLGVAEYPNYEVLLVRTRLVDPNDIDRLDELQQAIRRRLRSRYPGMVYFVNGDRIVFLHNFRGAISGIDVNAVQGLLAELHASSTLPPYTHLTALSDTAGRYELSRANDEVMSVYRLFDGSSGTNRSIRFKDLGVYKLLLQAPDMGALDQYVDPRIARLARDHSELFTTIVTLCEHSLDYARAAEALYVHPKTVRYRVGRVRDLCGIDVKNPDDYLQVILASKILDLTRTE